MRASAAPPLRSAAARDAASLAALSIQVFLDTYATEGVRPDLAREAFVEYGVDAFAARLREPARRFLLVERGAGLIGYAELRLDPLCAPVGGTVGAELVRLYVQPDFQRQGLGRHLLRASEAAALSGGLDAVWLTAWDGNLRARAFYAALGYRDVGTTTYSFQGLTYGNRVLTRKIGPATLRAS